MGYKAFAYCGLIAGSLAMGWGCSGSGPQRGDGSVAPNKDAYFVQDPPQQICYPDGGMSEVLDPGGTIDCPSDKNREGCPCPEEGATASCWPGARVNRNRGICHDGMTTCTRVNEFDSVWGPCVGAVLPVPGTAGKQACDCFAKGYWQIDNTTICVFNYNSATYVYSATLENGQSKCTPFELPAIVNRSSTQWSPNRLSMGDCAGKFRICFVIRKGNFESPKSTDCEVGRACTEGWYPARDAVAELPALPGWVASDTTCGRSFANTPRTESAGYAEMTVLGRSEECQSIDNGSGGERAFNRIPFCPLDCNNPAFANTHSVCQRCGMSASGQF